MTIAKERLYLHRRHLLSWQRNLETGLRRLDALAAEAAPHHADYTLRQFAGPVPDDLVAEFGALVGSLPLVILYAFFVEHYVSAMTGAVKE